MPNLNQVSKALKKTIKLWESRVEDHENMINFTYCPLCDLFNDACSDCIIVFESGNRCYAHPAYIDYNYAGTNEEWDQAKIHAAEIVVELKRLRDGLK